MKITIEIQTGKNGLFVAGVDAFAELPESTKTEIVHGLNAVRKDFVTEYVIEDALICSGNEVTYENMEKARAMRKGIEETITTSANMALLDFDIDAE